MFVTFEGPDFRRNRAFAQWLHKRHVAESGPAHAGCWWFPGASNLGAGVQHARLKPVWSDDPAFPELVEHSMLTAERHAAAFEIQRVLRYGGLAVTADWAPHALVHGVDPMLDWLRTAHVLLPIADLNVLLPASTEREIVRRGYDSLWAAPHSAGQWIVAEGVNDEAKQASIWAHVQLLQRQRAQQF